MLLESARSAQAGLTIGLGIGINVSRAPEGTGREVASLGLQPTDVRAVFDAFSQSLTRWRAIWDEGRAFFAIREAWLARAVGLDTVVGVHLRDKIMRGTFRGIDRTGALQLETAPGVVVSVAAGDIYPDLSD
jgi:BirA family biotin operon repressor/biotin-[acetyl-CoA-carboxylase] ligase